MSELNLEPGQLVGGYTLISRLGAGAMGSVWRVRDDGGQVYAMKVLRDSLSEDDIDPANPDDPAVRERLTARERLRREAMALRKVRHPGVCQIVDMELDDSLAFIVTELIEGKNLRDDVAANGRYVADDLERLARKLIEAVRAVHAAGIVHRDIKPTNVMVSASGPVLVDFGIAMGEGESHVTRTGLVMGTPGFIAPEIIDGAESDEQTDWWSLASVLAFAATGAPVFGSKPMMAVLERAAAGNANLNGLPAGTMAAFRAALDPDRSKRCTPEQLLQAIELDAMNPFAWEAALGETGETEVVRPFDGAAPASGGRPALARLAGTAYAAADGDDPRNMSSRGRSLPWDDEEPGIDNPRTLWRPAATGEGAMPATIAAIGAGGTAILPTGAASDGGTTILPATAMNDGGTTVLPASPAATGGNVTGGGAGTAILPTAATTTDDRTAVMAADADSGEPATRVIASTPIHVESPLAEPGRLDAGGATAVMPATAVPQATSVLPAGGMPQSTTVPPSGTADARTTAMPAAAATTPAQPAPAYTPMQAPMQTTAAPAQAPGALGTAASMQAPAQPGQQPQPPQPAIDPTWLKHRAYYDKGMPPCLLLTAPIALLAASAPLIAMLLMAALLWLMLTAGLSTEAQLRRESRHGGERRGGDVLWRLASLPWHALKGLALTLPRMAAALVVFLCGTALAIPVAQLPTGTFVLPLGTGGFSLTLPSDAPASATGATLALFTACGWLFAAMAISPDTVRIGAGALSGLADLALRRAPRTPAPGYAPGTARPPYADGETAPRLTPHAAVAAALWAATTVAACALLAAGTFVDWSPLFAL